MGRFNRNLILTKGEHVRDIDFQIRSPKSEVIKKEKKNVYLSKYIFLIYFC